MKTTESASGEHEEKVIKISESSNSCISDLSTQYVNFEQLNKEFDAIVRERDNLLDECKSLREHCGMLNDEILNIKKGVEVAYEASLWCFKAPLRRLIESLDAKKSSLLVDNRLADKAPLAAEPIDEGSVKDGVKSTHILLVSYYCPTRAHAGGLRILDLYTLIRRQCPHVQLDLYTHSRPEIDWNIDDVYKIFDNVYLSPEEELSPNGIRKITGGNVFYSLIDLQFHQCGYQVDAFKKLGEKIIYTPMESLAKALYYELRSLPLVKKAFPLRKKVASLRYAAEELYFLPKVDEVVCVSKSDAAFLRAVTSEKHICGLETGVSQYEFSDALSSDYITTPASSRPLRVLYVAYFGSETNVNALRWYLNNVHGLIKKEVPKYIFTVVGRGDLASFSDYTDLSIEFVGEVPTLAPNIQEARVGIAPALGGSGFRGKVNQYSVLGIPSVVSSIAFKGLSYQNGVDIFIADSPENFADKCIQLLVNVELNDKMGNAARKRCLDRYTWQSKWENISKIYELGDEV